MYNGSNWLLGEALSFASVWKLFKSLQQQMTVHTVYSSLTTFSFSSSLVSLVSPGLFWRARWCQMSPSQVPAMWRRRGRFLRRTTDDWRRETDSSSSARSQTHSPGVWLWRWNTGTQTAWTQSLKTYLVLCHFLFYYVEQRGTPKLIQCYFYASHNSCTSSCLLVHTV